jgi:cation diffusion facilitator CzcD-associated flavoprotein CzcO
MNPRICVIGAGPSGITAAKNCIESGLDVVVFEKNDKVGGNWVFNSKTGHSSVYENTHLISSKAWSEFEDYPMPDSYPDYPSHIHLQNYFESYAVHFGVMPRIKFDHNVNHVTRQHDGKWLVEYTDNSGVKKSEVFEYLMVSNGHHNVPKYPEYPGNYSGKFLHSHDFKGVDESWRDKRVLVIGGGNSACDISVEAARMTKTVHMSMRSPQWFFPKFIFGQPGDVFAARSKWLPRKLRQYGLKFLVKIIQGPYSRYGLPENTTLPLTNHPTLNSDLMDYIRHGRIKPRKAIKSWSGLTVEFVDGSKEDFDIVCAATGFWTTFPFFDEDFINFKNLTEVPLFKKMMHEKYENLYFIGLFQPLGCIWPLADYQAKIACLEINGRYRRPKDMKSAIDHEVKNPHFNFTPGQRHAVEVDYHLFRKELKGELKKAGLDIGKSPAGNKKLYKNFADDLLRIKVS